MARIGLVDVDNTGFPNIALGKIATYHKSIGDEVVWVDPLFGCDTHRQIEECRKAMQMIDKHRKNPAQYLLYTMIGDNINEDYERLSAFRDNNRVRIVGQPYRDFNNPNQIIPQWQKDMARWAMRREIYATCDFKDYEPRKGFKCKEYLK